MRDSFGINQDDDMLSQKILGHLRVNPGLVRFLSSYCDFVDKQAQIKDLAKQGKITASTASGNPLIVALYNQTKS